MHNVPIFNSLDSLGLSDNEAKIYTILVESGKKSAKSLVDMTKIGRGNVYNILNELENKGLILSIQGKKTHYQALPPTQLEDLFQQKKHEFDQFTEQFKTELAQLSKRYRYATGKPTFEVFEGLEGAKRAIADTLQSKSVIRTYLDVNALTGDLQKANSTYISARVKKKIPKRILVRDTPDVRAFFKKQNSPFTEVGYLPSFAHAFSATTQIYTNAVSFITLREERMISSIIRDSDIFEMQKQIFDHLWQQSTVITLRNTQD